jgi:DNA-binding NarL/FixJ family response regulator
MIRVVLADDQPLVRAGIAMLLEAEADIDLVGQAGDGIQAVELSRSTQPDLVVMDVRMPLMDGVTATRQITADGFSADADRPVQVLILTTYHVDEAVYAAIRAGASGFLLKDAVPKELSLAIRAIVAGEAWLDPAVTRRLIDQFAAQPERRFPTAAEMALLTAREREVLVHVAFGLSNAEIAAHLVLGEATVKTHLSRVIMKLNLRDRAQAVAVAYQSGLVVPGTPPPAAPRGPR